MTDEEKKLIIELQSVLTPDLVPTEFRRHPENPMFGQCYGAAEALYRLLGGKDRGYKAQRAVDDENTSHWWVLSPNGDILDPTSAQYTGLGKTPPYVKGKGASFRRVSNRAATIMERVKSKRERVL